MRGVQLHRVLPTGELVPDGAVELGRMDGCPSAAAAATGAAVIAGAVGFGERAAVMMTVREPGGAFGAPLRVEVPARGFAQDIRVAVAPDGAAVVAWSEWVEGVTRHRLRVVRRRAGEAFGASVTLVSGEVLSVVSAAAIDPAGTATVAWWRYGERLEAATAEPGRPFGARQHLRPAELGVAALDLATAPDGGLLLVAVEFDVVRLFEQAPGERRLRDGPVYPRPDALVLGEHPAVALAAGGGAVVAWIESVLGKGDTIRLVRRAPGGAFSAPLALADVGSPRLDSVRGGALAPLAAAVGPDGGAVVGWLATGPGYRLDQRVHARVAAGAVGGGLERPVEGGSAGRSADAVAVLATPPTLLWTDNLPEPGAGGDDSAAGDGRLHRAVAGAPPAPSVPAPELTVSAPAQRVHREDKVIVKAHCSAACDLRAVSAPPHDAFAAGRMAGPGTAILRLTAGSAARSPAATASRCPSWCVRPHPAAPTSPSSGSPSRSAARSPRRRSRRGTCASCVAASA